MNHRDRHDPDLPPIHADVDDACVPIALKAKGRSRRLIAAAHVDDEGGVLIRVDDAAALEFWIEISLDPAVLVEIGKRVLQVRAQAAAGDR